MASCWNHVGTVFVLGRFLGAFFTSCCACGRFSSKNLRKSKILVSQNSPKILPKRFRKRYPNKHAIFQRFWLEKTSVARAPTSISYWFFQYFLLVGHFSSNRFWHGFWIQKTYQKPIQNDARTLKKSMLKTYWFFTSIFSRLGLDLGASWASKLELSWLKIEKSLVWVTPLERS